MFPERDIYAYSLDGQTRYADPLAVIRQLKLFTRGRFNALCEAQNALARADGPVDEAQLVAGLQATGELAAATCFAFGLEPFDPMTGSGLTEKEALAILFAFLTWQDSKKDSGRTSSV